jgi:hypothetical protein
MGQNLMRRRQVNIIQETPLDPLDERIESQPIWLTRDID